jgi:hypothetical protein
MAFDYYKAPKQEVFEEIKKKAIELWNTYDNQFGYVDEKVGQIKDIKNIGDNTGYIVAMFDHINQSKLYDMVGEESKEYIDNCWKLSRGEI